MAARNYSNTASGASLAGTLAAGATSVALNNYSNFPAAPFTATIDRNLATEEIVLVTAVTGSTVTLTRGYDSTAAQAHAAGASFEHTAVATDFREAQAHINATSGVHGATGAVADTSSVQTLANKTLTSPTINTPTVTAPTVTGGQTVAGGQSVTGGSTVDTLTVTGASAALPAGMTAGGKAVGRFLGTVAAGTGTPGLTSLTGMQLGDTVYAPDYGCHLVLVADYLNGGAVTWRQLTPVITSAPIATFVSTATAAGVTSFHNGFLVFDSNNDILYVATGGTAFAEVLSADSGWITATTGFTAATGWTLSSVSYKNRGGHVSGTATLTRTAATTLTGSATGNIGDEDCLSAMPAKARPGALLSHIWETNNSFGTASVSAAGVATLKTLHATATVATGGTITLRWEGLQ